MLDSFIVALMVAALLGYLAGLGVGGGSLLILWLSMAVKMAPEEARIINLMFFLASAGAVTLLRWKQGSLQLIQILPGMLGGCAAAAAASLLSQNIDTEWLKKLFGGLLIAAGLRELLYRPRKFK